MKFHVIAGLPRSGSTLLCNVLNQNPRFFVSNTSMIAQSVRALSNQWSKSPEVKSELINDKEGTEKRMSRALAALVEGWYEGKGEVVFDKGRFWNFGALVLHSVFPDAKMFVCVRDLRAVFASIEKQHEKNPILDEAGSPMEITKFNRANRMFSDNGLIGQQIMGVDDLLRRRPGYVQYIQYEAFVKDPQMVMDRIYLTMGEKPFDHDFENIVQARPTDVDGLYNDKYPHEGTGKVEDREEKWSDFVPGDIARLIMGKFQNYNRAFGYT